MRYFLAKRQAGPALFVADRIDTLRIGARGGRPRRPVSSELHAHGAGASRRRAAAGRLSRSRSDLHALLHADARRRCLPTSTRSAAATSARSPSRWRSGSRRIDASGNRRADRRLLLGRHRQRRGLPRHVPRDAAPRPVAGPAQGVRAEPGGGPDVAQAREFLTRLGLSLFLEEIEADPADLDLDETLRVLEDYKPLDVECAAVGLRSAAASARAIPSGGISPTATAATRTSRTTRSRRTPSSRSAASSTT